METLVILFTILSVVRATYLKVQTWSFQSIDVALKSNDENPVSPDFRRCLEAALNVMEDMYEFSSPDSGPPTSGLLIPAPSGAANWTTRELLKALKIIENIEGKSNKTYVDKSSARYWTTNKLNDLMFHIISGHPTGTTDQNKFREINYLIVSTMLYIKENLDKYDFNKDTFHMLLPAVDISIWTPSEMNKVISERTAKLISWIPYLKHARKNEMQKSDNGEQYCVITPVGIIPQEDPYDYLPDRTKKLLKMARVHKGKEKTSFTNDGE